MILGHLGHEWGTTKRQKTLNFERKMASRPHAHGAHRFLHTHTKIDNIPSVNIYTYSIIYIYNIIIINYIYSIYTIHSICDIARIYNILCNIKNRWTRWACGRTTVKALSINAFETFANAPFASTRPHFFGFIIKDNAPRSDISAFHHERCAFLTMSSKCPEISTFSPLVLRTFSEHNHKSPDTTAFFSWFQHLFNKNTYKCPIFQALYKTETIHMSKSDSYIKTIKISENNNDKL
jgi:hypothetical protein